MELYLASTQLEKLAILRGILTGEMPMPDGKNRREAALEVVNNMGMQLAMLFPEMHMQQLEDQRKSKPFGFAEFAQRKAA